MVLISRVSELEIETFIGTKSDFQVTLTAIIQKETCLSNLNSLLLTVAPRTATIHTSTVNKLTTNFKPWKSVLPEDNTGLVYILVITNITNMFYIGETVWFRRRPREHNSGQGADSIRSIKRPWAALAFITGFCTTKMVTNMRQRKGFESTLNYKVTQIGTNIAVPTIFQILRDCLVWYSSANELKNLISKLFNVVTFKFILRLPASQSDQRASILTFISNCPSCWFTFCCSFETDSMCLACLVDNKFFRQPLIPINEKQKKIDN